MTRGKSCGKTRRRTGVWLIAGGVAVAALLGGAPAVATDITVTDVLPTDILPTDVPTLLPDGPVDQLLGDDPTAPPLPDPLPEGLPDPGPAESGGGTPAGGSQPGGPGSTGGSGAGSGSDAGADATSRPDPGTGSQAGDDASSDGDEKSTIKRASSLTGSAGTLAANVADLAGPLSVPLGLMAAAAAALIIATRRPTALRKVDEEGTWGNDGRSHRL